MQKKLLGIMILLLCIPALLSTVACQKKVMAVKHKKRAASLAAVQTPPSSSPVKQAAAGGTEAASGSAAQTATLMMDEDVYFDFDKSTLTAEARDTLMRKAQWLRANTGVRLTIEGHCDERGTSEYNLALGDRRAEAARIFLVDLGIDPARLTTVSYGEERPADPGHNEQAWAKNRRAHFARR